MRVFNLQDFLKEALALKDQGNKEFAEKNYLESILRYSEGLRLCPLVYTNDRSVLYSNRAASKHKLVTLMEFYGVLGWIYVFRVCLSVCS